MSWRAEKLTITVKDPLGKGGVHALSSLAHIAGGHLGGRDTWVADVTQDSREARPGWLFAAVEGTRTNGHRYAGEAVKAGASGLLVSHRLDLPVPQLVVPSVRSVLGRCAAALHGWPSEDLTVVGVTGTNGKTTTTMLLCSIWEAAGWQHGLIGTVETRLGSRRTPSLLTTPPAPQLQRTLSNMREAGARTVAMEVSSHALDQLRVDGINFEIGLFLNLAPEHLDYHGTVEHYWASKASLFSSDRCRHAIVCVDDSWGERLAAQASIPVTTFSRHGGAQVTYQILRSDLSGTSVHVQGPGESVELASARVVGPWNAPNMVAAYLSARLLGISPDTAAAGLAKFEGAPGRFELVDTGQDFLVIVDYAHTPEAVAALARLGRRLVRSGGRVWMVIGATGERDRLKRPSLGGAAALADVAILTTDSPAHEDPAAIIEQMRVGTLGAANTTVVIEPDRSRAIELAVGGAGPGDVVFVAGRGHETTQLIGDQRVPIDDRAAARAILARRGLTEGPGAPMAGVADARSL